MVPRTVTAYLAELGGEVRGLGRGVPDLAQLQVSSSAVSARQPSWQIVCPSVITAEAPCEQLSIAAVISVLPGSGHQLLQCALQPKQHMHRVARGAPSARR
jgi:hypothetical protein